MDLLPRTVEDFAAKDYWNTFFAKRGPVAFEWYGEYSTLSPLLHKYVKPKDNILIIGCGNSTLSADLYDNACKNVTSIDVSEVVINQMVQANEGKRPDLVFRQMDARDMSFEDGQFSVVLDKGTLDALMPDDRPETLNEINKLFSEIERVLRFGGRYLCVSLLQEHILNKLLDYFPAAGWMFRVCRCNSVKQNFDYKGREKFSFPVFVVVCTKFKKMANVSPVLELCVNGEHIQRVPTCVEVISSVKSLQQTALVCSRLNHRDIADCGEILLNLYRFNEDIPRYTVHVLDQTFAREKTRRFAAFIVPQGRETEWVFSTPEGRRTLQKSSGFDRLAVVSLNRDHTYNGLEAVQKELADSIKELTPPGLGDHYQIPFLSIGAHVGHREVCYRGHSELSGDFVVEEIEGDRGQLFRRLIFLNNQSLVQTEARIKLLKSRKGKPKKVVDVGYLASEYLAYMIVGVSLGYPETSECRIAVIGLGGGSLCSFLHYCFPRIKITAVDIDPVMLDVATDYFNLTQDDRLEVYIRNGIHYLQQAAEKGLTFSVILFDVDNKDHANGMSCPPANFLESKVLNCVKKCIGESGYFVLNLATRSHVMRQKAINALKAVFPSVSSYSLEQEVNEIVFCSIKRIPTGEVWKQTIQSAAEQVNGLAKKKKIQTGDLVDVTNLINSLKITS